MKLLIKINYINEENKNKFSIKKLGIIGVVTTQLLLSGCGPQEKPPVDEPITDIDEFIKKDDEVVIVNGEQKTVKELKEEHGVLYHFYIDYTDEQIEDMFETYLKITKISKEYGEKNWPSIRDGKLPRIDFRGNYYLHGSDDFHKVQEFFGIYSIECYQKMRSIDNENINLLKKYLIKHQGEYYFDYVTIVDKFFGDQITLEEALSSKKEDKRATVMWNLFNGEIFDLAAEKTGYKFEKAKEINFKTNFINDENYIYDFEKNIVKIKV